MLPHKVEIIENAWLARLAAYKMNSQRVAMVLGQRIYLWGVSKADFLQHPAWVKHELAHVAQYQRYGTIQFVLLYLLEWMKKGYYNNRFEIEARAAEQQP